MPTCRKCGIDFPYRILIGGVWKIVNTRKFCLGCSPYKEHNTRASLSSKNPRCKCGQTDPTKFYGRKTGYCGECHNRYTISRGMKKREFAIAHLGGKCSNLECGFFKYKSALDIHHLDPARKDPNFQNFRGWSEERIVRELTNCVLLCKICHTAYHSGELHLDFPECSLVAQAPVLGTG